MAQTQRNRRKSFISVTTETFEVRHMNTAFVSALHKKPRFQTGAVEPVSSNQSDNFHYWKSFFVLMGVSSVILALALALYVAPAPTAAAAAAGTRRAQVTQLTVDVAFLKTQLTSTLAELNATKQTLAVETSRALMTDAHFSSMFDQAASTYLSQSSASIYVTSAAAAATYGTLPTGTRTHHSHSASLVHCAHMTCFESWQCPRAMIRGRLLISHFLLRR